ncbi:MAG TPA: HEAT repeat domain-containing protein [Vicinamibacterales bacterium]
MRVRAIAIPALAVLLPSALAIGQSRPVNNLLPPGTPEGVHAGASVEERGQRQPTRPGSSCRQLDDAVVVRDGRLSVRAADQSLALLLRAISRCTPQLAISVAPELEADSVSIVIADVPVDEGLRRIVDAYDAFFYYGGAPSSPAIERLWVFPRGRGYALAPLDTAVWASDADVDRRLADPDPDTRFRALKALIERRGATAIDAVLTALADPDETMRAKVLDLAFGRGLQIPPDRLTALVVSDSSALIRLQALQYFPDGPELVSVAEAAQTDPNPYVQMEAKAILARVAAAAAGGIRQQPVPQR